MGPKRWLTMIFENWVHIWKVKNYWPRFLILKYILLILPKSGIPTWECLFTNWENWEGKRWRNHLSATAIAVLCNGFKNWRPLMKPKKRSKRSLLGLSYNTCQGKRLDTMYVMSARYRKKENELIFLQYFTENKRTISVCKRFTQPCVTLILSTTY